MLAQGKYSSVCTAFKELGKRLSDGGVTAPGSGSTCETFMLCFDDPAAVPAERCRSLACFVFKKGKTVPPEGA